MRKSAPKLPKGVIDHENMESRGRRGHFAPGACRRPGPEDPPHPSRSPAVHQRRLPSKGAFHRPHPNRRSHGSDLSMVAQRRFPHRTHLELPSRDYPEHHHGLVHLEELRGDDATGDPVAATPADRQSAIFGELWPVSPGIFRPPNFLLTSITNCNIIIADCDKRSSYQMYNKV